MASEPIDVAVRETLAALAGLQDGLTGGAVPPPLLLAPLASVGDALRLGLELARPIRRWLEALGPKEVDEALRTLVSEVEALDLPEVGACDADDDPSVGVVVRLRDQAHSVVTAVRRALSPRGSGAAELASMRALVLALRAVDERLAMLLSRGDVARLLGTRAALGAPWSDAFQQPAGREEDGTDAVPDVEAAKAEVARLAVPADEIVTAYVRDGAFARYVEGFAAQAPDFAEELADCIDALREAGETVGLLARRWRRDHERAPLRTGEAAPARAPLHFGEVPGLALAAATTAEIQEPRRETRLGALTPVEAEARLIVTPREVTVRVFPEREGSVQAVQLGTESAEKPATGAPWSVTIAVPEGAVRLRVAGAGGELVEMVSFGREDEAG